ncbi:MAG: glutamate--tRNA ligase [Bacteroidota bacterium]
MPQPTRVRFAPSPTGFLHVGGLRTALYNFLFARHNSGQFILRIEDTDQSRKVEGAVENLIETLRWAGIDFDEGPGRTGDFGPYTQSERLPIYHEHVNRLVSGGHAYYCFCTPERLDQVRKQQQAMKLPPAYDRHCRDLPREESEKRHREGESGVIRMKVPIGGEMTFEDIIRGNVTIAHKVLDDQVLLKSDGFPTYHLAVVVDDHLMKISHVIRGEEWLPSTPKHIMLYKYFGWEVPQFAHLPLLLNPDRSKLSKRQGDVAVEDYRKKGYLREAIVNFIAFLGWNPGDERELFTLDDLIRDFTLERVGKSGAVFNVEKLNWLNQQHLRLKPEKEISALLKPLLAEAGVPEQSEPYLLSVIALMKERVTVIPDFVDFAGYFFSDPTEYDEKGKQKHWNEGSKKALVALADRLALVASFTTQSIEEVLRILAEELNVSAGKLIHPTRLALSGRVVGPGLFEMMELLGKDTVVRRLRRAMELM